MFPLRRLLENPLVLIFLSALYPAVFTASNNWFIYSKREIILLLVLTPILALAIGCLLYFIVFLLYKLLLYVLPRLQRHLSLRALREAGVTLFSCGTVFYLLQSTTEALLNNSSTLLILSFVGVTIVAFTLSRRLGLSPIVFFLFTLTVIASLQWAISLLLHFRQTF